MSVLYVRDKDGNLVPIPFISGGGGGIDPDFAAAIYAELDKKIDKLEPHVTAPAAIILNTDGTYTIYPVSGYAEGQTLVRREAGGVVRVGSAIAADDAVPLKQLESIIDGLIGDIDTALDEVHAYAQSLVNGGVTE